VIAPARVAAYRALHAIAAERADLPSALVQSRQSLVDERDRALAAEIVTGTLRWQRSLDYLITHFVARQRRRIDPEVLTILRLSMFQMLHLDRVPAAAVVDDAVKLTRVVRKSSAAGFVNGVLRELLRQRKRLPLPPRPFDVEVRSQSTDYLGITQSHPHWLVSRWLDRYGFEATERWVRFNNETPPLTLSVNRLRGSVEAAIDLLTRDHMKVERTRFAAAGLTVHSGNPLRREQDGLFFVQDEASQLVPEVLAAHAGERVLDLCASPGGKTVIIAADIGDSGVIVASDVRARRVRLLERTVSLSGVRSVRIIQIATTGDLPFSECFDRVLVDAPCSGLGTIRRDPDIRWRRQPRDLAAFAREQTTMILRAGRVLKVGGRLVYATCSSEPDENEHVVDGILAAHPEFELVDLRSEPLRAALAPLIDARGMFRTLPFAHGLEAFFAAAMRKRLPR
jgi:16S rRNA (cytosine967-C5)-methyltransferase